MSIALGKPDLPYIAKEVMRVENESVTVVVNDITCEGLLTRYNRHVPLPGIVICHPHPLRGGDMSNNVVVALAEAFALAGFAVLRFNFRGVGKSTGRYAEGIGEQIDAKAALAWLSTLPEMDTDRLFLAGYSFGARVALEVAATDLHVRGLIAVAPPVRHSWPSFMSVPGPKIFCCGEHDPVAPPEVLRDLIKGLPDPKRLAIFPGADHFFVGQERLLAQHAVRLLQELA